MSLTITALLHAISASPGCSTSPPKDLDRTRVLPAGCPGDIAECVSASGGFLLHAAPTADGQGLLVNPNSFEFDPRFDRSVAGSVLDGPADYEDPAYAGFDQCYTLGYFGEGNSQLILDLTIPDRPRLRHLYFFPTRPLANYKVIPCSFTDFVRRVLELGPDQSFLDTDI